MLGTEVAPGVWRWTAYFEEWRDDVGAVAIRRDDRLILVDPIFGPGQWDLLSDSTSLGISVLLTIHWHARDTSKVVENRPSSEVWAYSRDLAPIRRRTPVTDIFKIGDPLPGGLVAIPTKRSTEVAFWDPESRSLITGDSLLGDGAGGLKPCPDSWMPDGATAADMAASLEPVLDLPVDQVLVSHGDPVLGNGRGKLAEALDRHGR